MTRGYCLDEFSSTMFETDGQIDHGRGKHDYVLQKVVCGGEPGVGIVAVQLAKIALLETGGWVPPGYSSSMTNLAYSQMFGFREVWGCDNIVNSYITRHRRNIDESDGTLIIRSKNSTLAEYCRDAHWIHYRHLHKADRLFTPSVFQVVDSGPGVYRPVATVPRFTALVVEQVRAWIQRNNIRTLNLYGSQQLTIDQKYGSMTLGSFLSSIFRPEPVFVE